MLNEPTTYDCNDKSLYDKPRVFSVTHENLKIIFEKKQNV